MKDVKVIKSEELSHGWERRYVVDTVTRDVLDDVQGYGYKSIQNAYAAYNYKSRSKEKAKEIKEEEKKIFGWLKEHKPFCSDLEAASFYAVKGGVSLNTKSKITHNVWIKTLLSLRNLSFRK